MATIDQLRRRITQQCEGCPTRRVDEPAPFRKEELAGIVGELSFVNNPQRMTAVGLRLSVANILGFSDHAGERAFRIEELRDIHERIRERQQEVRARG